VGVFFAVFAVTCAALDRCLPFPEVPRVREKLEHLARHGDEYDVLFIGSSEVDWQVVPAVFDRVAGQQGVPVRSFNAGVWAMMSPEDGYFLDQILRRPHRRLRWIFLEIMPLASRNYPALAGTRREIYWHDWPRTQLLTERFVLESVAARMGSQHISSAILDGLRSCGNWLNNLTLFLEYSANLGRGETLCRRALGLPVETEKRAREKEEAWDGNDFPKGAPALSGQMRVDYERQYAKYLATGQRFDSEDAASWAALRGKIDRLAEEKITPVMFIPATVAMKRYLPREAEALSLKVLDFSDPRRYPEFYTADHRVDWVHLNYAGSELFTEALARRFVEMTKANGATP
jgi:hypothetical protein